MEQKRVIMLSPCPLTTHHVTVGSTHLNDVEIEAFQMS
jgi:hypothetical protein